jgi:hypothetical protein
MAGPSIITDCYALNAGQRINKRVGVKLVENNSLSTIELAERLNVTPGRVRQIALSLGLSRKGRDWLFTAEDIEKIGAHTRAGADVAVVEAAMSDTIKRRPKK